MPESEVEPLFVMISFENLPLIVQMQFVKILEDMYDE